MAANRVTLDTDSEEFALHGVYIPLFGDVRCEDRVETLFEPLTGSGAVDRHVLVAVGNPDVGHDGIAEFFSDVGGDFAAGDAVVDPVLADAGIGAAQGEATFGHRMAEAGGIEIEPELLLLRPFDPGAEMLARQLRSVGDLGGIGVNRVEIQALGTGNQRSGFVHVRPELLGRAGPARIIPGRSDPAAIARAAFEAVHVVSLPAMQRDRGLGQGLECFFRVDAEGGVAFERFRV